MHVRALVLLLSLSLPHGLALAETVLVTGLAGRVNVADPAGPLHPFARLKAGQRLALDADARLQIVYLGSGRHESWNGPGRLDIGEGDSRSGDLAAPRVRQIPPLALEQLAKTPSVDGVAPPQRRQRRLPPADAVGRIETTYRLMRAEAAAEDLDPELYLLSGMFELRQLDRVEEIVADIMRKRPGDPQAKLLASLYRKSLKDLRESGK
ncbi:MAG: hypothetical protein HZB40_02190 [Rhodocyclales bacterium]|nr:hypothetical protein [Rhodocyclales bacterium]